MILLLTTIVVLLASILLAMNFFNRNNKFVVDGRTVVVTGGSQGLGLSIAKQLAAKGANVVIVAQTVSKLESALREIEDHAKSQRRCIYLSYDLRSPHSAPEIIERVTKWNDGRPPDVVFNCAGNCIPGFFASSSVETHRSQMDTIYWTCAYMAHATLEAWTKSSKEREHQPRHLVFTASVLALFPLAGYASYNPAKAAMRSLADTLNQEVQVYNGARSSSDGPVAEIKVHIAFPMGIQSPGYENEQKTKPSLTQKLEEDDKPQDPDDLARILISGLEGGQYMLTSTLVGHLMRGWGMGASQRTSILDYFWSWLGAIVIIFVAPDFMSKCRKWGMEKGLSGVQ